MKPQIKLSSLNVLLMASLLFIAMISCQKETKEKLPNEEIATTSNNNNEQGHLKQTKEFSADVVIRWLNMQLDMLRVPLATGTGSQAAERALGYCGIATYESVVRG